MHPAEPITPCWLATLDLDFQRRGATTVLASRKHYGPLRVQKSLYPEGADICHAIVLHPPAGIAGGDRLQISSAVGANAHALLTTPGAGKWYRSGGTFAEQDVSIKVGAGGTAEWLPQEGIFFNGAEASMRTKIELGKNARFIGVETLCFGRRASGEAFDKGSLHLHMDVTLEGKPLWRERGLIEGGSALMNSPVGLAGYSVCSTVLAAGMDVPPETLSACRQATLTEKDATFGLSAMPNIFVGRYLGHSPEAARHWFIALWQHLRPALMSREMMVPRIWHT